MASPAQATGNRAGQARLDAKAQQIHAMRQFLISKGYAIPSTGNHIGHAMASALQDWHSGAGNRDPHAWTQHYLGAQARSNMAHDPTRVGNSADLAPNALIHARTKYNMAHDPTLSHKGGIDVPTTAAQKKSVGMPYKSAPHKGGGGGGGGGNSGKVNPTGTSKALKAAVGNNIDPSTADFGQLFNVDKMAQAMAQEQFQPQINESQLTVNRDPVQAAQNEKDVKDWYNQVIAAQGKATGADKTATQQGVDATNAATQALVSSLGGSANQGSGEAAAAGQNGANTLAAIGASQAGLDQELAPLLQAQQAQQQTNQARGDQAKQQADQLALQDLQGQEGNAQTSAQMQLQSANNSLDQSRQAALQQILEYNNGLRQQKYQNELGMMNAQIAAAMNGVNMAKTAAQTNYYNSKAAHGGRGGGGMSASQINDVQRQLMAALGSKGLIVSPSAGVYKLAPGVKPQDVLQFSQHFDQSYGGLPGNFAPNTLNAIQGY